MNKSLSEEIYTRLQNKIDHSSTIAATDIRKVLNEFKYIRNRITSSKQRTDLKRESF